MAGHTPGPWEVGKLAHTVMFGHEHGGVMAVPLRTGMHDTRDEAEANARLIAAAPDLLAAAVGVIFDLELLVSRQGPGPDRRLAALKAAIAKTELS